MKKPLLLILLYAVLTMGPASAQQPAQDLAVAVDSAVETLITEKKQAGSAVLIARGGKILHLNAYGMQSLDSGQKTATDTIFRIHSMTKAIVSAAALQQWEQGKYKLSDPVAKYIPAFEKLTVFQEDGPAIPAKNVMTVEQLFLHTSGLAYSFTCPPALAEAYSSKQLWGGDLEQFCEELAKIPLVTEPGAAWTYGVGIDVLGRLVEVWSGQPLDQYLEKEFFEPLGMKDTGFSLKTDEQKARFAAMHQVSENGVTTGADPLGQKYQRQPSLISGGGGLVSTVTDYYQFLQMIADGGQRNGQTFLKPETIAMMTSNRLPATIPDIAFGPEVRRNFGFGLGFSVVKGASQWDTAAAKGEFGWGGAASCHYWVSSKDDNLIVITMEQTNPYNWHMERVLKPLVYKAVR